MAKPDITPSPILIRQPAKQGRVVGKDMDRLSLISDERGASLPASQAEEANSNQPDRRGSIPSGTGTPEEGSLEGTGQVPIPPASGNPFVGSDNILQTIADHFVEARKLQKAEAWRQLQVNLMYASPYICPVIIPYKDLISIVSDIEKEIKGSTAQQGKSNEEIMADFLSGTGSLVIVETNLAPEAHNRLDTSDIIPEDGGDTTTHADIPLSRDGNEPPASPPSSS